MELLPCLSMQVRLRTFHGWPETELSPFFMAMANFSALSVENNKGIAICLSCGVVVQSMRKGVDSLIVHCVLRPTCDFIKKELDQCEISLILDSNDVKSILNKHLYLS